MEDQGLNGGGSQSRSPARRAFLAFGLKSLSSRAMPRRQASRRDDPLAVYIDCFLCRQKFRFGANIYDGRGIGAWGVSFCRICVSGNHDGIVLESHPRLEAHLKERGVPIRLNARGWLDIPN